MIQFEVEIKYSLKEKRRIKEWLNLVAFEEGSKIQNLNFLIVGDKRMIHFNKTYLNHDYSTDIITFDNSENKKISGDIVISIERVKENSKKYKVKLEDELRRVMAHGLLHLLGYDDKNEKEKKRIRKKENYYLEMY
ncbi:rRNA maturation RNase YbeY [bacterium]|jgi:probable rRNA maturation factor|nr:rRNA maturation RNase YbeY [bacterium]|tara:strand:- start:32 stop:439 length:408 start_codon:yes stop_codon:yes gene_type:complete